MNGIDSGAIDMFDDDGAERRAGTPNRDLEGKRILVVDDNRINLDVATETLETSGAIVDSAAGGGEALKYVAKTKYDLVLLDLTMPDIDGRAVGRAIRSSGDNVKTPILLFTASDANEARRAVAELGAQGFVPKPVDIDDLLARVCQHI